tara:strand:- start:11641 stop:12579 length:939 start_codon:yes stop_codon:yes gene_type:complete
LKIIFFGSPSYTHFIIDEILKQKYDLQTVITQDSKIGKRGKIQKTPVEIYSDIININCLKPKNLQDKDLINILSDMRPDLFIIYSYGKILPKDLINIPKYGALNIHCSLLPKWRGAAPIQRALLNGDKKTGITFFKIDENLDTGDIISSFDYVIKADDDTLTLQTNLSKLAASKLNDVIKLIKNNSVLIKQNNNESLYARKIHKSEAQIEWNDTGKNILNQIRAFVEWPIAEANIINNTIKISSASYAQSKHSNKPGEILGFSKDGLSIAVNDGIIIIHKLQLPSRNMITAGDLYNSNENLSKSLKKILNIR